MHIDCISPPHTLLLGLLTFVHNPQKSCSGRRTFRLSESCWQENMKCSSPSTLSRTCSKLCNQRRTQHANFNACCDFCFCIEHTHSYINAGMPILTRALIAHTHFHWVPVRLELRKWRPSSELPGIWREVRSFGSNSCSMRQGSQVISGDIMQAF